MGMVLRDDKVRSWKPSDASDDKREDAQDRCDLARSSHSGDLDHPQVIRRFTPVAGGNRMPYIWCEDRNVVTTESEIVRQVECGPRAAADMRKEVIREIEDSQELALP